MNRTILKIVTLTLFFAAFNIYSYERPLKLHHYAQREWSSISGLVHDNVTALYVGEQGVVWVGTIEGLSRVAGSGIKTFSTRKTPELLSNRIVDIAGNSSGEIAVATEMGVSIIRKSTVTNVFKEVGLVGVALKDNGVIYAATQNELYRIGGKKIEKFNIINGLPKGKITRLADNSKSVIFGNDSGAVHKFEAGSFSQDLCELNRSAVTAITYSADGSIAFGTRQGQIFRISNEKCEQISIDAAVAVTALPVLSISMAKGVIKAVTGDYILSVDGKDVTAFRDRALLPGSLSSVVFDSNKKMWVAGNRGLKLFYAGAFITLGKDEGLSSELVYAMVEDKLEKIWVGTRGGGLFYYVDGKFNQVTGASGLPSRFIGGLMVDKAGYVWAGTAKGVIKFSPELPVKIESVSTVKKEVAPLVSVLFQDSKNRVWAGTANGEVYMLLKDGFAFIRKIGNGKNDYISAITEDGAGRLLFATSRGILVLENDTFKMIDVNNGLPDNMILSLFWDKKSDRIFAGTMRKGVIVISLNEKKVDVGKLDTTKGLCSDTVYSISEDSEGSLWFTSTQGIFNLRKEDVLKAAGNEKYSLRCSNFDQQDGVKRTENTGGVQPSALFSRENRKWFPTVDGIAVKYMGTSGVASAHIVIDDFIVNGNGQDRGKKLKGDVALLEIPFAAGRFIHPERLKVRYRLFPFESDWNEVNERYVAIYQKVPAGDYEFVVEVENEDGKVFRRSEKFSIAGINSFTFAGLTILVVFSALAGIVFYRKKKQHQKKKSSISKETGRAENIDKNQKLEDDNPKYEKSRLDDEIAKSYAGELKQLMLEKKVFTDPELTMPELAKMLDLSPNVLSQVINGYCGLNFYTYVNNFRADEVVEIMKRDVERKKSVLDVAFTAGFKSKTTFNTFFKKHTGLTPSEFRKQLERDQKKKK